MDENSKRKIDFITITSPVSTGNNYQQINSSIFLIFLNKIQIEKKLKNDVKSNFENYRLFDNESDGDEQLTKAQDSIQQVIN